MLSSPKLSDPVLWSGITAVSRVIHRKRVPCCLAALFFLVSFAPRSFAAPTASVTATFHNVGIEVTFPAAPADDGRIDVFLRPDGSSVPRRAGHSLSRISPTVFAGSVFGLEPGSAYDILLTGSALASEISLVATTRQDDFSSVPLRIYHVSPDGNDGNSGASEAEAFATLGHALAIATAGSKILMHNGRYLEGDLFAPRSGTAASPIVIEGAPGAKPVLDGTDPNFVPTWTLHDAANAIYRTPCASQPTNAYLDGEHFFHYLNLDDLTAGRWSMPGGYFADGSNLYARFPGNAAPAGHVLTIPRFTTGLTIDHKSYIHLRGIGFAYYGFDLFHQGIYINGGDHNLIDSCGFHHNGVGVSLKRTADFNTVQNCTFEESPIQNWNWHGVKEGGVSYEGGGVGVYTSNLPNTGNVIRYNTFKNLFDGAHLYSGDLAGPTRHMDFHDNVITACRDDAIETDGAGSNVRIYNNVIRDFLTGISVAPCAIGPTYIFRNVLSDWHLVDGFGGYPFKFNVVSPLTIDWIYLYHNTCHTARPDQHGFLFKAYSNWSNVISRNNIYSGTGYALENWSSVNPVDFGYDNLHTTHDTRYLRWAGTNYGNLASFSAATGQEASGIEGAPDFVDSPNGVFSLAPSSPLIDRAVRIPGINDGFTRAAPDIGAVEFALKPLSVKLSNGEVVTEWAVSKGSTYQLQSSPNLTPSSWGNLGDPFVAGQSIVVLVNPAPSGGSQFYRLVQILP